MGSGAVGSGVADRVVTEKNAHNLLCISIEVYMLLQLLNLATCAHTCTCTSTKHDPNSILILKLRHFNTSNQGASLQSTKLFPNLTC